MSHARVPTGPRSGRGVLIFASIGTMLLVGFALLGALHRTDAHASADGHGSPPPLWQLGSIPFASLLLSIAILPLVPSLAGWWHQNRNKLLVSLLASAATLTFLAVQGSDERALSAAAVGVIGDFLPFMCLLFALYVVSGGIAVEGDLTARPRTTTAFLAFGAVIASALGTTGASMLLIRPLLTTTRGRTYRAHTVVFFIFLVSNIGGTLLPIGDPPLFLGYLKGVPFMWTLTLWKEWAFATVTLLIVHWIIDSVLWHREPVAVRVLEPIQRTPLTVTGWMNVLWLIGIVLTVALVDPSRPLPLIGTRPIPYLREVMLVAFAGLSVLTTPAHARAANRFAYGAILEVAAIFLGIFVAMQVPLSALHAYGAQLGVVSPGQFFWVTGTLSSFLDNAPTYVVFVGAATALTPPPGTATILLRGDIPIAEPLLAAISLGAVFMGANTYIGNAPNFMVRSLAEESGVRMPSFFGYMLWSCVVLLPLFAAVHWFFLR